MKTDEIPGSVQVLLVALLAIFIIPVISYTGMINSKMNLPAWLSGVEEWMRTKEDTASDMTGLLLKSSGIGELVLNIFILSVIPSIGEEMIFRGILQQILIRFFRSGHAGIWITSIIFSAIHFQFFGFLPRLILGLSFGYLFFWSGNLWLSIIAHFINNAIPVAMSYFFSWNELNVKAKGFAEKQLLLVVFAAFLIAGVFYYFWSEHRKSPVGSN
jgi:membrane protease YdiL (CAAX protease family)